jgi:hypothetical protein
VGGVRAARAIKDFVSDRTTKYSQNRAAVVLDFAHVRTTRNLLAIANSVNFFAGLEAERDPKTSGARGTARSSFRFWPGGAARSVAATIIAELTPYPAAHGCHFLPARDVREYASFSLGEKVAEERGRMRGLVIHELLAKKTSIKELAMHCENYTVSVRAFKTYACWQNLYSAKEAGIAVSRNPSASRSLRP